jgi:hypothetical protein
MRYSFLYLFIVSYSLNAQHIDFTPTSFSNLFSLNVKPALTIKSGDVINTETIDAAGFDKHGVKRQKGGNPLTGPFISKMHWQAICWQ